jgi:Cadherin-like
MITLAGRETPSGASMHGRLNVDLAEELPVGTVVVADVLRDSGLQLDAASGLSGAQLDVISGSFRDYFRINGATGSLVVNSVIDRDVICRHK